MTIDAVIEDVDYKELTLHSDVIKIATLLVSEAFFAIAINLVSSFMYDWFKGSLRGKVNSKIVVTISEEIPKDLLNERYSGPAKDYKETCLMLYLMPVGCTRS
ncbi:MAG: hypothetical protein R3C44_24430 [Chloroflexota bacterium]